MMKTSFILLLALTFQLSVNAFNSSMVETYKWEDLEVVYVPDERYPTYTLSIYFADGALADGSRKGVTGAAFDFLTLGTRRYPQKDIADHLEFFAANNGASTTHESVTYSVSGLVKDITPTMKMICHLFDDADYPKRELASELKRWHESVKNMVNDRGALASHLFRESSMKGTPISYPVSGKLKDIKRIRRSDLKKQLSYFNNKVKKRIYLTGPKKVLSIKDTILKECGWQGKASFVRGVKDDIKTIGPKIVLVTVPQANQAQVRIGRLLEKNEITKRELLDFVPGFLGGGFTSRLMRVLRTREGLVYGAGARAAAQKNYGRAFISTSTANTKLEKLLTLTKATIDGIIGGDIPDEEFERSQGLLAAGFPFRFESSEVLLSQLIELDHSGLPYSTLETYQRRIYALKKNDLKEGMKALYSWDKQTILVLGTKDLYKALRKFGPVQVVPYQKLL
jgi:zinc protease